MPVAARHAIGYSVARRRAIAARIRALQARRRAMMAADLREFFRGQAARVVRRFLAQHNLPDAIAGLAEATKYAGTWAYEHHAYIEHLDGSLLPLSFAMVLERKDEYIELFPDAEDGFLRTVMNPYIAGQWLDTANVAGDLVGLQSPHQTDPRLQDRLAQAGDRIVGINNATRANVRDALVTAGERGYNPYQIAHGVPADDFRGISAIVSGTYRGRAETIARTELAMASQGAAIDRYRDASVTEVDVDDGPDCGWTEHDDPDLADGSRRDIDDAEANDIAHPNCVRSFLPVIDSAAASDQGDGGAVDEDQPDESGPSLDEQAPPVDDQAPAADDSFEPAPLELDPDLYDRAPRPPRPSRARPKPEAAPRPAEPILPARTDGTMTAAEVRASMTALGSTPEMRAIEAEIETLQAEAIRAYRQDGVLPTSNPAYVRWNTLASNLRALKEQANANVRDLFKQDRPAKFDVIFDHQFSPATMATIDAGIAAFRDLVGDRVPLDGWLKELHVSGDLSRSLSSDRAYYVAGAMHLYENVRIETVVHEMSHWLEGNSSRAGKMTAEEYNGRTAGTTIEQMGRGYAKQEITYPDEFADRYMGKYYGGGPNHELLSMSIQLLHEDPVAFALKDPKSFDFVWNTLHPPRGANEPAAVARPPAVVPPPRVVPPPVTPPIVPPRVVPPVVRPPTVRPPRVRPPRPPRTVPVTPRVPPTTPRVRPPRPPRKPPTTPRPPRPPRVRPPRVVPVTPRVRPPRPPRTRVPLVPRPPTATRVRPPRLPRFTPAMPFRQQP